MSIMLGNLSVNQIESRLGIEFPKDIQEFMNDTHQANAGNVAKDKWHCFDVPFNIVCGDIDIATKIYESVKEKANLCKEPLHFSIQN